MKEKLKELAMAVVKPLLTKKAIAGIIVAAVALAGITLAPETVDGIAAAISQMLEGLTAAEETLATPPIEA